MPLHSTNSEARLKNIVGSLHIIVDTLEILSNGLNTPLLISISNTTRTVLGSVQTSEALIEYDRCFIEAQQDKSRIRQFFRQGEMSRMLKECNTGLDKALEVFTVAATSHIYDIKDFQKSAEEKHQEVLQLIEYLSDGASSEGISSFDGGLARLQNSTTSISMLPSEPKIFHGRDSEVLDIINAFTKGTPRIAILGAGERPAKVHWTRPFLPPLRPLSYNAACQTFIDIAEDHHDIKDIDKILFLTDGLPLAIDLIAHLVDCEGCPTILARWETEKTALLSDGHDQRSNLEISISLSLASPRIVALPDARNLLGLLSMLPDGLSEIVLSQSKIPIPNILSCKAVLLQTSLAYIDDKKHLKALVPIREYMHTFHRPEDLLIQPLLKHFRSLLATYNAYGGTESGHGLAAQLASNIANIQNLFSHGLQNNIDLADTIDGTFAFDRFAYINNRGPTPLMDKIPSLLPQVDDARLEVRFISNTLNRSMDGPISSPEALAQRALDFFPCFDDFDAKWGLLDSVAHYYYNHSDVALALKHHQAALSLSISAGNMVKQSTTLNQLGWIKYRLGNYSAGQEYAYESCWLARISGNLWGEADALRLDAQCSSTALGNYKHAILQLQQATSCINRSGLSHGDLHHRTMWSLAEVHMAKSEYREAQIIFDEITKQVSLDESPSTHAFAILNIAEIQRRSGEPEENILKNIATAKPIFQTLGYTRGVAFCDVTIAALNLRQGNLIDAKLHFRWLLQSWWGKEAEISKQKLEIHNAIQFLGDLFLAEGDEGTAINLFMVALDGFTFMEVHQSRGECMLRLGDISRQHGNIYKAIGLWQAARPLFERSSQMKQVANIDQRLYSSDNLGLLSRLHPPTSTIMEASHTDDQTQDKRAKAVGT
ncbi:hypothetical protein DFH07DRAFT_1029615 [Mycena maculata]|uniref:Uncharacterized protein n=1 Tax=Mycena maculata TaxID=230809 RepID=A0AAD7J3A9_9AGAR|nr:hypothetical protein DFH07DRAFT_1029615 [Mycena maculata]